MLCVKFEIKTKDRNFVFELCDVETDILEPEHFTKAVEHFIKVHKPNLPTRAIKSVKVLKII